MGGFLCLEIIESFGWVGRLVDMKIGKSSYKVSSGVVVFCIIFTYSFYRCKIIIVRKKIGGRNGGKGLERLWRKGSLKF